MPNQFVAGDIVKTIPAMATQKAGGVVAYIACGDARLSSLAAIPCDKKTCTHGVKDYVWVRWQGSVGLSVFNYQELELDASPQLSMPDTIPGIPVVEPVKVSIPEEVKDKINDAVKHFGKKPIDAKDLDWDTYNGFKRANSLNVVRKRQS